LIPFTKQNGIKIIEDSLIRFEGTLTSLIKLLCNTLFTDIEEKKGIGNILPYYRRPPRNQV